MSSVYFNLVTILSLGYGDIVANTLNERLYLLFFLFTSNIAYSMIISWLYSIFSQSSIKEEYIQKRHEILEQIIDEYGTNYALEKMVKK